MPGMRLDFLKNPSQRVATGKSLPLKQVEAILIYGKPDVKSKVIQKILPATYALSLDSSTHHLLLTLLDHSDNLVRVQMLYHVRRKVLDLCISPAGNVVLQRLLEKLPARQRKEVAEGFTLSVDAEEFRRICTHPFGNHVAQKLLGYVECAGVLAPVLRPHLRELAGHPFGMRVVARYVAEVEDGWREVLRSFAPEIPWEEVETFAEDDATAEAIDAALHPLLTAEVESMVVAALVRHVRTPLPVKDAICAHLCEFAVDYLHPDEVAARKHKAPKQLAEDFAGPDFAIPSARRRKGKEGAGAEAASARHPHLFAAVFESGDAAQREALWRAIHPPSPNDDEAREGDLLEAILARRATVPVVVAALKSHEGSRAAIWRALFHRRVGKQEGGTNEAVEALTAVELAQDPVRSVILRGFIDVDPGRLGREARQPLYRESLALSQNPVSSPVLQRLIEVDGVEGEASGAIYPVIRADLARLMQHASASYLIQSLLQFAPAEVREMVQEDLLPVFTANLRETLAHAQGSRVMQKLLAYATDEAVVEVVKRLIRDAEAAVAVEQEEEAEGSDSDQEKAPQRQKLSPMAQRALNRSRHYDIQSSAIISYALHQHACYVIRSLLHETRSRKLDQERKLLMNELKPHVFNLAVSPWAGRVVLDAMMEAGSEQLAKAIKNVVFLKAEAWLSQVSEERKKKGSGVDPTVRAILQEQRKRAREGDDTIVESNHEKSALKKKSRQIHRTLKK